MNLRHFYAGSRQTASLGNLRTRNTQNLCTHSDMAVFTTQSCNKTGSSLDIDDCRKNKLSNAFSKTYAHKKAQEYNNPIQGAVVAALTNPQLCSKIQFTTECWKVRKCIYSESLFHLLQI